MADGAAASPSPSPYRRSLLRRERSQVTRRGLVRAAAHLWAEKAYERTTVEEICAAAGVGRTTYYLHFETKEQLLGELAWATARGVAADVDDAVGAGGLDEQLDAFVKGLVRRMESVPASLAALVLRTVIAGTAPASKPPDAVVFDDILEGIFRAAQDRGEIEMDMDAAELGAILGGMVMDALHRWATERSSTTSLRDALQLRVDLIVDGIRR